MHHHWYSWFCSRNILYGSKVSINHCKLIFVYWFLSFSLTLIWFFIQGHLKKTSLHQRSSNDQSFGVLNHDELCACSMCRINLFANWVKHLKSRNTNSIFISRDFNMCTEQKEQATRKKPAICDDYLLFMLLAAKCLSTIKLL